MKKKVMMEKMLMASVAIGLVASALVMPREAEAYSKGLPTAGSIAVLPLMVSAMGVYYLTEGVVTGSKAVAALPVKAVEAVGHGIGGSTQKKGAGNMKAQKTAWGYDVKPLAVTEQTVTVRRIVAKEGGAK